jgi:8-oxo-dGTP diphosphatase
MPHGWKDSRSRKACVRAVRVGAILCRDGRILVIRHRHDDPAKEYWVLPGGGLEPGETPAEGARREMREETGLTVRVERLAYVHDQEYRGERQLSLYFLCSVEGGEARPGAELLKSKGGYVHELVWIPPEELREKPFFPEVFRKRLGEDGPQGFPQEGVYFD